MGRLGLSLGGCLNNSSLALVFGVIPIPIPWLAFP
jgi:hypothetical protein